MSDTEYIAEQHDLGGCADKIASLEAEVERMRPIVEAAQKWKLADDEGLDTEAALTLESLYNAITAYGEGRSG